MIELKMVSPYVFMNAQQLGPYIHGVEGLKGMMKEALERKDKFNQLKAAINGYSEAASGQEREYSENLKKNNTDRVLTKLYASRCVTYNSDLLKNINKKIGLRAELVDSILKDIDSAVSYYVGQKGEIMSIASKCRQQNLRSPYECYRDFG